MNWTELIEAYFVAKQRTFSPNTGVFAYPPETVHSAAPGIQQGFVQNRATWWI
jgi:hypothetical protein